ncbi:MAG: PhoH family protein [Desulfovibrio sp.]|nr:PhoH family protein [Desulfovibrio sp.]
MERLLFDAPNLCALVFGPGNLHLEILQKASGAHIFNRGATLCIDTPDKTVAKTLLKLFVELYDRVKQGKMIEAESLPAYYHALHTPSSALPEPNDIPKHESRVFDTPKKQVVARNPAQVRYMDLLQSHDIVFALGCAGTGKTYLACASAVQMLLRHQVKKIILTRPAVEAGEKLGFLPGDLTEKIDPYLRPLYDALYDMLSKPKVSALLELGSIEIAPLAFMRGRTLNEACIILDEAQNTTKEQMKMFLTRMGFGSKMIITGDLSQIDLPLLGQTSKFSGLLHASQILRHIPAIAFHTFTNEDVVRHPLVGAIVNAYDIDENRNTHV